MENGLKSRGAAWYHNQLQDPRWEKKREKILERDNYRCVKCNSCYRLNVHHKHYIKKRRPWQYPDHLLETLCEICHENEHIH